MEIIIIWILSITTFLILLHLHHVGLKIKILKDQLQNEMRTKKHTSDRIMVDMVFKEANKQWKEHIIMLYAAIIKTEHINEIVKEFDDIVNNTGKRHLIFNYHQMKINDIPRIN